MAIADGKKPTYFSAIYACVIQNKPASLNSYEKTGSLCGRVGEREGGWVSVWVREFVCGWVGE